MSALEKSAYIWIRQSLKFTFRLLFCHVTSLALDYLEVGANLQQSLYGIVAAHCIRRVLPVGLCVHRAVLVQQGTCTVMISAESGPEGPSEWWMLDTPMTSAGICLTAATSDGSMFASGTDWLGADTSSPARHQGTLQRLLKTTATRVGGPQAACCSCRVCHWCRANPVAQCTLMTCTALHVGHAYGL